MEQRSCRSVVSMTSDEEQSQREQPSAGSGNVGDGHFKLEAPKSANVKESGTKTYIDVGQWSTKPVRLADHYEAVRSYIDHSYIEVYLTKVMHKFVRAGPGSTSCAMPSLHQQLSEASCSKGAYAKLLAEYFDDVCSHSHVLWEPFAFITSTPHNRRTFMLRLRPLIANASWEHRQVEPTVKVISWRAAYEISRLVCHDIPQGIYESSANLAHCIDQFTTSTSVHYTLMNNDAGQKQHQAIKLAYFLVALELYVCCTEFLQECCVVHQDIFESDVAKDTEHTGASSDGEVVDSSNTFTHDTGKDHAMEDRVGKGNAMEDRAGNSPPDTSGGTGHSGEETVVSDSLLDKERQADDQARNTSEISETEHLPLEGCKEGDNVDISVCHEAAASTCEGKHNGSSTNTTAIQYTPLVQVSCLKWLEQLENDVYSKYAWPECVAGHEVTNRPSVECLTAAFSVFPADGKCNIPELFSALALCHEVEMAHCDQQRSSTLAGKELQDYFGYSQLQTLASDIVTSSSDSPNPQI